MCERCDVLDVRMHDSKRNQDTTVGEKRYRTSSEIAMPIDASSAHRYLKT